jgi:hypothetical protein
MVCATKRISKTKIPGLPNRLPDQLDHAAAQWLTADQGHGLTDVRAGKNRLAAAKDDWNQRQRHFIYQPRVMGLPNQLTAVQVDVFVTGQRLGLGHQRSDVAACHVDRRNRKVQLPVGGHHNRCVAVGPRAVKTADHVQRSPAHQQAADVGHERCVTAVTAKDIWAWEPRQVVVFSSHKAVDAGGKKDADTGHGGLSGGRARRVATPGRGCQCERKVTAGCLPLVWSYRARQTGRFLKTTRESAATAQYSRPIAPLIPSPWRRSWR